MTVRHILQHGTELNDDERSQLQKIIDSQRTDLEGLRQRLDDAKSRAVDFITDTRAAMVVPIPDGTQIPKVAEIERMHLRTPSVALVPRNDGEDWYDRCGPIAFNAHAHSQIRGHLAEDTRENGGKPTLSPGWYRWMLQNDPEMFCFTVNKLFDRTHARRMFRVLLGDQRFADGHTRAYLSDKYRRMDFIEFVDHVIFPELESDPSGWMPTRCATTDLRSHIELMMPNLKADIKVGETVAMTLKFQGSDVGAGAVDISAGITNLRCTNLLISDTVLRKIHVGAKQDDFLEELLTDETKALDDQVVFRKLRDAMRSLKSRDHFDRFVTAVREADRKEVADPVGACELLTENVGLTGAEHEALKTNLLTDGNPTPWGLINGLTAVAREAEFERKTELERAAGKLLFQRPDDWRPYMEAESQAKQRAYA